ncbi:uncharacterized protein [Palaemon carinicauda]|uniref:uncharacterized protein n=1 Tax=Palaemon carinicauda TaxID=392227 RepID=UPI0035B587D6
MRSLFILLAVVAAAYSQINLGILETMSQDEVRTLMQNKQRVKFNVNCLIADTSPQQCFQDPLHLPLRNAVTAFASDRSICKSCNGDQRRKVALILSRLQQDYTQEYNQLARKFGFS